MQLPLDTDTPIYSAGTIHYADGRMGYVFHVIPTTVTPVADVRISHLTIGPHTLAVQSASDAPPQLVETVPEEPPSAPSRRGRIVATPAEVTASEETP